MRQVSVSHCCLTYLMIYCWPIFSLHLNFFLGNAFQHTRHCLHRDNCVQRRRSHKLHRRPSASMDMRKSCRQDENQDAQKSQIKGYDLAERQEILNILRRICKSLNLGSPALIPLIQSQVDDSPQPVKRKLPRSFVVTSFNEYADIFAKRLKMLQQLNRDRKSGRRIANVDTGSLGIGESKSDVWTNPGV